jgi:bacteriochlorophyll 4-vinyl reductase
MADSNTNERFDGEIPASVPLSLLEAVRAHDRPAEVLEAEDLTVSLPRRFGLTGVVDTQIRQFEAAQRAGRNVRLDEVVNLMRLVLRRPDAALIMEDTGRRFAQWHFARRSPVLRKLYPKMPARLQSMAAARAIRKSLKQLKAGATITVTRQPFHVRIEKCLFPRIDSTGAACPFLTGLLQEQLRQYMQHDVSVSHTVCTASNAGRCEWSLNS